MTGGHDHETTYFHPYWDGDCEDMLRQAIERAAETYKRPEDIAYHATDEFARVMADGRKRGVFVDG